MRVLRTKNYTTIIQNDVLTFSVQLCQVKKVRRTAQQYCNAFTGWDGV
jgi:hypothetical protein